MSQRKHLPISRHQTLNGVLEVNWLQDYQGEFICPQCNQGRLTVYLSIKGYKKCPLFQRHSSATQAIKMIGLQKVGFNYIP